MGRKADGVAGWAGRGGAGTGVRLGEQCFKGPGFGSTYELLISFTRSSANAIVITPAKDLMETWDAARTKILCQNPVSKHLPSVLRNVEGREDKDCASES